MLHSKILIQKRLMQKACKQLEEIQTIERLITPVDPIYVKVMKAEMLNEYLGIMCELQAELMSINPSYLQ